MRRDDREQLRSQIDELVKLVDLADAITDAREKIRSDVDDAIAQLRSRAIGIENTSGLQWSAVVLSDRDSELPVRLAALRDLPELTKTDSEAVDWLRTTVREGAAAAEPLSHIHLFRGRRKLQPAHEAAAALPGLIAQSRDQSLDEMLSRLSEADAAHTRPSLADLVDESLGLSQRLGGQRGEVELVSRGDLDGLAAGIKTIKQIEDRDRKCIEQTALIAETVRDHETRRLLSDMPLEALRDVTNGRLPINALEAAGIKTVQDILDVNDLSEIDGVGEKTADRAAGAAFTLLKITRQDTPVRIDVRARGGPTTALLNALHDWRQVKRLALKTEYYELATVLGDLAAAPGREDTQAAVIAMGSVRAVQLVRAIRDLVDRASLVREMSAKVVTDAHDVWEDFLGHPADYYGMLTELGFETEDQEKTHGDLPEEVVEAVRAQELHTEVLKASLRGYQAFAARFAVVQKKVMIGDEMGLGKTVEALAALAHLHHTGERHFLVVCPAAVVTNWVRETAHHSELRAHRVHGPEAERTIVLRNWERAGGVAVTTYDLLPWVRGRLRTEPECVVFDEAHYVKNPGALRSRHAAEMINDVPRAILMTGTPLENRVAEFRTLAGYIRPDLAEKANEFNAIAFRRSIAPTYLRRNQEDVLDELPELIEIDEWVEMSTPDHGEYINAVIESNFMAMRRAAMMTPDSTKLARLLEIVEEAKANGRRVIVFSYFLDVLSNVACALNGRGFGPLTGKVPAVQRQELIDQFSNAGPGAVLVSQITAGGIGLNIQAASIVVICEPQLKPTAEAQAIARAHRMGQIHTVQVHRLLSENSVDERIVEILKVKRALFDQFARISDLAEAAPEAHDISEQEIARQVVAAERERLLGMPNSTEDQEAGA